MPNPKRQHSKQRGRKRRTHDAIVMSQLSACANCGKPIISHRVCPFCGHYRGAQILDMTVKDKQPAA